MIDLDAFGMVPNDILMTKASNEKMKRKQLGFTQQELARKSGASLPSLRQFDQKGEISLSSLVDIAICLGEQKGFRNLYPRQEYKSMEELLNAEHKQR